MLAIRAIPTFALAMVALMLASPGAPAGGGVTPLHAAAAKNPDPAAIAALLEAGADIDARDESGATPLHMAAALNPNPSVIAALLEAGADINASSEDGATPLHWAVFMNPNLAVIAALLEAGADINARSEGGFTPFDYAKNNKALEGTKVYQQLKATAGVHPGTRTDGTRPQRQSCQIEDWRWSYKRFKAVTVNGTSTCEEGKITIRAYDENGRFIGADYNAVRGYSFTMTFFNIPVSPRSLKIKYTIKRMQF